jgi:cytochrome c556
LAALLVCGICIAEGPAPRPAASTYAPAELLVAQVEDLTAGLSKKLASQETYAASQDVIARDANLVAAVCIVLAGHDEKHAMKQSSADRVAWARQLGEADDYQQARAAAEKLAAGKATTRVEADSSLQDSTELVLLMKQVAPLLSGINRNSRGSRFKSRASDSAQLAALIAVIGEAASHHGEDYAEDDDQLAKWRAYSAEMRDSAGAVVAGFGKTDQKAVQAALMQLDQSCKKCHEGFGINVK